jgi:hypothetical protein
MTDMTIENNDKKTKQALWKTELEELKKQRANKSLPVPVQRLIDGEISKLEERLGRWDEYTTLLGKTRSRMDRLSQKLSTLKKSQRQFEIFLGIDDEGQDKPRPKFVTEDVVSFIKKNGGNVTYGQLSEHFGLGRLKLKKNIDKNSSVFKTDTTVKPSKVSLK